MAEKVISEIKVVETEDGYRIEIRGDKDRIRKYAFPAHGWARHGPRSRFWRRWAWQASPWGWWWESPGSDSDSAAESQDATSKP
jgi:hypothetical protein